MLGTAILPLVPLPSPPSPVYLYCNFRHSPSNPLALFSVRSNGFLQITHRCSRHDGIRRTISIIVGGFLLPRLCPASNESPDIEFLRAGACSGTIMNKASSHPTIATAATMASLEECIFVPPSRFIRYLLSLYPEARTCSLARAILLATVFHLYSPLYAVKMEIYFSALFTARISRYVCANNSDDQFTDTHREGNKLVLRWKICSQQYHTRGKY